MSTNIDVKKIEEEGDTLGELFSQRDSIKTDDLDEKKEQVNKKEIPKIEPELEPEKKVKSNEAQKSDSKEKELETKNKADDTVKAEDVEDLRDQELEKLQKALNDSKKWGHASNRKLKNVSKMISGLKESGTITDEDFDKLNELVSSDFEEEEPAKELPSSPFGKLVHIAGDKLSDLAEIYEDDKLFTKKLEAFDSYVRYLSKDDCDDLIDELEALEGSPLKLAKKMYSIGEKFYNELYKDIEESGGLRDFISVKDLEIKKLKKKIDILQNKVLEYGYDKPNLRIDELGETEGTVEGKHNDTLGELFQERDRVRR